MDRYELVSGEGGTICTFSDTELPGLLEQWILSAPIYKLRKVCADVKTTRDGYRVVARVQFQFRRVGEDLFCIGRFGGDLKDMSTFTFKRKSVMNCAWVAMEVALAKAALRLQLLSMREES